LHLSDHDARSLVCGHLSPSRIDASNLGIIDGVPIAAGILYPFFTTFSSTR
jgi:hypothetical protein